MTPRKRCLIGVIGVERVDEGDDEVLDEVEHRRPDQGLPWGYRDRNMVPLVGAILRWSKLSE